MKVLYLILTIFLLLLIKSFAFAQYTIDKSNMNPFINMRYDEVHVYQFKPDLPPAKNLSIVQNWTVKVEFVSDSVILNSEQVQYFQKLLCDTNTYGSTTTESFEPNIGIVFFFKGSVISWINLSFDCNFLRASFYLSPMNFHNKIYAGESWVSSFIGFSKNGRFLLKNFFEGIGFRNFCYSGKTIFD